MGKCLSSVVTRRRQSAYIHVSIALQKNVVVDGEKIMGKIQAKLRSGAAAQGKKRDFLNFYFSVLLAIVSFDDEHLSHYNKTFLYF